MWIFSEYFFEKRSGFILLLDETKNLIDFVRNHISVLIFLIFYRMFSFSIYLGQVLTVVLSF